MESRNQLFDLYKGFLMWGVVWGHVITQFLIDEPNDIAIHWIFRTYDMPFFMLISGYFFSFSLRKNSVPVIILDKITSILFPSIFWSLLLSEFNSINEFYFLAAIFASSIIVAVANSITKNKIGQLIIFLLVETGLHFVNHRLDNIPYLFPFFIVGYYSKSVLNNKNILTILTGHKEIIKCSIFLIWIIALCFWKKSYTIWNAGSYILNPEYGSNLLFIIIFRFFIAISGICVVKYILDKVYYMNPSSGIIQFLISTGKETLGLYILHSFALVGLSKIVCGMANLLEVNIFTLNKPLLGYFISPIVSLLIIYLVRICIKIIKSNKFSSKLLGFKIATSK